MTTDRTPELHWADPAWLEKRDKPWARELRGRQARFRQDLPALAGFKARTAEKYRDPIAEPDCWTPGGLAAPNVAGRQQLVLNASLAESVLSHEHFTSGRAVVTACPDDDAARSSTRAVAGQQTGGVPLSWSPLDTLLDTLLDTAASGSHWGVDVRRRYLEQAS